MENFETFGENVDKMLDQGKAMFVPIQIFMSEELIIQEKHLYSIIFILSIEAEGYCYENDDRLYGRSGLHRNVIQQYLKALTDKDYIQMISAREDKEREFFAKRIYINWDKIGIE